MQRRPLGFVIAAAGLAVLVIALLGTPDASGFVLAAWILVLASVAAVAIGLAVGFRHQAGLDDEQKPSYLTADWLAGAQLFTVGEAAEPPGPEPEPEPEPAPEAALAPDPVACIEPDPAATTTTRPVPGRSPRIAAALVAASALRELIRPGRAVR